MKVLTIFGTRPEIIRLSLVAKILDQNCDHVMLHTGQNFDPALSDVFFRELELRDPDIHLGIKSVSFGDQAGQILAKVDEVLASESPDRTLILGDTNSGLSAIAAARRGIPVFHMEAGNRCFDNRVPEEVNRRIIDHSSDVLLPYTERSRQNLLREGIDSDRIFVTGNPIKEVIDSVADGIEASDVVPRLGVRPFEFFLVTLHRAENVDLPGRLSDLFAGLSAVASKFDKPILVSVHPRTASRIENQKIAIDPERIRLLEPMGLVDFVKLEKNALAVLTDSGTVQEECSIFGIPNVTLRDVTERPETLECGSNIIAGSDPESMVSSVGLAISQPASWRPPHEYLAPNVSQTVSKIMLGHHAFRRR